jgi:hypothetical protein
MVTRVRSCKDKHWHRSRGAAEAHVRALERLGKADVRTEAYACRYCQGWHVGRKPSKMGA